MALLFAVAFRFRAGANPEPSKQSHNLPLEVVWTLIPCAILIGLAVPSMRLLLFQTAIPPEIGLTVKATGNQWYWSYEYPDHGAFEYDSNLLDGKALDERRRLDPIAPRLLAVDNEMILPADTAVRVIVTAGDVLHNWAVQSLGARIDAVPGRLNEIWIAPAEEGIYYGQCSELCGTGHAYMPIAVRVVSKDRFEQWANVAAEDPQRAQQELLTRLALNPDDTPRIALNHNKRTSLGAPK